MAELIKQKFGYSIELEDKFYYIKSGNEYVVTPRGQKVRTLYLELAEALLEDILQFGEESYSYPTSLLSYHFTCMDGFSRMGDEAPDALLNTGWENEWTFKPCPSPDPIKTMEWVMIMGHPNERIDQIRNWIKKCSCMQLSAIACVYNYYMSMNLAYMMAVAIELQDTEENKKEAIKEIAKYFNTYDYSFDINEFKYIFEKFDLYYGIHFKEDGVKVK